LNRLAPLNIHRLEFWRVLFPPRFYIET
jgi:hypothetical protein